MLPIVINAFEKTLGPLQASIGGNQARVRSQAGIFKIRAHRGPRVVWGLKKVYGETYPGLRTGLVEDVLHLSLLQEGSANKRSLLNKSRYSLPHMLCGELPRLSTPRGYLHGSSLEYTPSVHTVDLT